MSDPDHEDLIVEVLCDGEFFLRVSQEAGFENMRVAIQPRKDGEPWSVSMSDLEAVLRSSASRLWQLRKG